jgi:tRNA threonylcarbamoyladenosine biosynthesis protein TsaE
VIEHSVTGCSAIEREIISTSPEETIRHGRELGAQLHSPVLVLLSGELGAGKTTLTKGLISGLGAAREEEVTSPTFTLVHAFRNHVKVYHVDLYRVSGFSDLETLGLDDILAQPAVVIVEWPEKLTLRTDWPVLKIRLEHVDDTRRRIAITRQPNELAGVPPKEA